MDLGEKGNRTNFGQKLTKTGGNRKVMGIVTPNSDMVCGNPQETKINPNKSKSRETVSILRFFWFVLPKRCVALADWLPTPFLQSVVKCKAKHLFDKKMVSLSGLATRNIFVSISFSGFKMKSYTFPSWQEESSDSDQKYRSMSYTVVHVQQYLVYKLILLAVRQALLLKIKCGVRVTFHNVHFEVPVSVPGAVTGPVVTVT